MIASFKCKDTQKLATGIRVPRFVNIERAARKKLDMLDAATSIADLKAPPSNNLEKLIGDRAGQYSIRINLQWRICFEWKGSAPHDVEIVDYH